MYAVVAHYVKAAGIEVAVLRLHGLRATAATNALEHEADRFMGNPYANQRWARSEIPL